MDILEKVKKTLRISHDKIDDLLTEDIETARAEMIRAGVSVYTANAAGDKLIDSAIVAYCLWKNAADAQKEGYWKSWEMQLDNLRKSTAYRE